MNQKVIKSKKRREALKKGFRSGLELTVSKILTKNNIKWDYEKTKLIYEQKITHKKVECSLCGSTSIIQQREYLPDFYLVKQDVYLEVKGLLTAKDKKKMLDVIKCNPSVKIIMVFQTPKRKLSPKSKKTYSDWCNEHNIDWKSLDDLKNF